jgi:hypothetical protein
MPKTLRSGRWVSDFITTKKQRKDLEQTVAYNGAKDFDYHLFIHHQQVLSCLEYQDWPAMMRINRNWKTVCQTPALWKPRADGHGLTVDHSCTIFQDLQLYQRGIVTHFTVNKSYDRLFTANWPYFIQTLTNLKYVTVEDTRCYYTLFHMLSSRVNHNTNIILTVNSDFADHSLVLATKSIKGLRVGGRIIMYSSTAIPHVRALYTTKMSGSLPFCDVELLHVVNCPEWWFGDQSRLKTLIIDGYDAVRDITSTGILYRVEYLQCKVTDQSRFSTWLCFISARGCLKRIKTLICVFKTDESANIEIKSFNRIDLLTSGNLSTTLGMWDIINTTEDELSAKNRAMFEEVAFRK